MGTVGEVFIYLVPILLGSVVESFVLRDGTAGIVIAIEIGASAVSAILVSSLVSRLRVRAVGIACIVVVILGDFSSSFVDTVEVFVVVRVVAAFGAGALFALANSLAARTRHPEKTYAMLGIAVILAATVGFLILTVAIERFGPQAAFAALAVLSLLGVPFLLWLPVEARMPAGGGKREWLAIGSFRGMALAMLLGFFILFVGQNAVWVYVERIGMAIGLPLAEISTILVLNGFIALLGPFAAHRLGTRFGRVVPIVTGMLIQMVTVITLVYSFERLGYGASMIILSLSYVFVIPYFRGVMASLDPVGRVVGASTAFVSVGAAAGPAFGGVVLNMGGERLRDGGVDRGRALAPDAGAGDARRPPGRRPGPAAGDRIATGRLARPVTAIRRRTQPRSGAAGRRAEALDGQAVPRASARAPLPRARLRGGVVLTSRSAFAPASILPSAGTPPEARGRRSGSERPQSAAMIRPSSSQRASWRGSAPCPSWGGSGRSEWLVT